VALVLGLGCLLGHLWPLFRPGACAAWLRRFHRNTPVGVVLMLLGSVWFEQNLQNSEISDFAAFRPFLLGGVIAIGVASCFVVRDYLSVRALAIVLCLVADVVLDAQRWHPSPWRYLVTVWMYVWVTLAIWVALSPWRVRDGLDWCARSEGRVRLLGLSGVIWGALISALAVTVYR
jgi:hypothetical protein